jgi:DNA repair protein SbcD/Mre11
MGKESFRFIHASDFHLERPLHGLLDLPQHLTAHLADAPRAATEAIFTAALDARADFVLLVGDLLNPMGTGAWGPAFLLSQFERLAAAKTPIFWATGDVDLAERWPEAATLPEHVTRFDSHHVSSSVFRRNGIPLATILGRGQQGSESLHASQFTHEPDQNFTIAMGHAAADPEDLALESVDYWALGGSHQRRLLRNAQPTIGYCGTPQGRAFDEPGGHGCWLVDVDPEGELQLQPLEVDTFRYFELSIKPVELDETSNLHQLFTQRVHRLQTEFGGRHSLLRWRVQLESQHLPQWGPGQIEELLLWLRSEFGHGQPAVWTTDIQVMPPKTLPEAWHKEDTILGDYLRTLAELRADATRSVSLADYLAQETPGGGLWQSLLEPGSKADMNQAMEQASLLGVNLLSGHRIDLTAPIRRL